MSELTDGAVDYVRSGLEQRTDPEKAAGMQAYMKTDMPFYGVQKAGRTQIARGLVKEFVPSNADEYRDLVLVLWTRPSREEKYLALSVSRHFKEFIIPDQLPLYRQLIIEGAWWDFVDEVATKPIRSLVLNYPGETWPAVDPWIDNEDMWLRRTAIICQVGLKEDTDSDRLFRFCQMRMDEKEFFIRKAIGWSLREYAKTNPEAVAGFALKHRDELSGLSFREATKHIGDLIS